MRNRKWIRFEERIKTKHGVRCVIQVDNVVVVLLLLIGLRPLE
jgi:hypothetical protein